MFILNFREKLLACLNEVVYYDEIATPFTRLLHDFRDYIATLKHYKIPVPLEVDANGIITLEQMAAIVSKPIPGLSVASNSSGLVTIASNAAVSHLNNAYIKLKPKLLESLDERRRALENGASGTLAQQQAFNVTSMAALAGAATMLHCLPIAPQPLNPLVKPLMESIKREENEELQKLAAKHLAHLVNYCVDRVPSPNTKIVTNLCTFLCSDVEFTPQVNGKSAESEKFNGIITLTNRQKHAERVVYNRGAGVGSTISRGPGRPPNTEIPLVELFACEEPEAKAASTRRRGANLALISIGIDWQIFRFHVKR